MAVIFGLLTPIFLTTSEILGKHLTQPRINFNPATLPFSAYTCLGTVILIIGIIYWSGHEFKLHMYILGLFSSSFDVLATFCIINALNHGPGGPCAAIFGLCNVLFAIEEAIRKGKMFSEFELVGLLCGVYGGLILVVPNLFEKYCFCCCRCRKK